MKQSRFAAAFYSLALALALAAVPASATVVYEYHSFCELDCQNVGLLPGDAVGGVIGFSDDAVALGVVVSPTDVEYFDVQFGVYEFLLPSLGSAFAVFTGPDQEAFTFQFITNAAGTSPGYAFAQTNWVAGGSVFEAAYGGPGSLRRLVSEPGSVELLAAGLVAWVVRRRRGATRRR